MPRNHRAGSLVSIQAISPDAPAFRDKARSARIPDAPRRGSPAAASRTKGSAPLRTNLRRYNLQFGIPPSLCNMPASRTPRIATICVEGAPAQSVDKNGARLELLRSAITQIEHRARHDPRWCELDAIVLPGGYFRLGRNTGCADFRARVAVLTEAGLVDPLCSVMANLRSSPSACCVGGVDGPASDKMRRAGETGGGDQLCVGWTVAGVTAIGRKVFPTWEAYPKTGDYEGDRFTCCAEDYATGDRVLRLRCGQHALLCACYDMFAVADCGAESRARAAKVQHIMEAGTTYHRAASSAQGREAFARVSDHCLARWCDRIREGDLHVALSAIHGFEDGSTAFWQRHGIAGASAALRGGLAIGAAHFATLPSTRDRSTLAAKGVSARHASQGTSRRAHKLIPADGFTIESAGRAPAALVRVFA